MWGAGNHRIKACAVCKEHHQILQSETHHLRIQAIIAC